MQLVPGDQEFGILFMKKMLLHRQFTTSTECATLRISSLPQYIHAFPNQSNDDKMSELWDWNHSSDRVPPILFGGRTEKIISGTGPF